MKRDISYEPKPIAQKMIPETKSLKQFQLEMRSNLSSRSGSYSAEQQNIPKTAKSKPVMLKKSRVFRNKRDGTSLHDQRRSF